MTKYQSDGSDNWTPVSEATADEGERVVNWPIYDHLGQGQRFLVVDIDGTFGQSEALGFAANGDPWEGHEGLEGVHRPGCDYLVGADVFFDGANYSDPDIGRYISENPSLAANGGTNLYTLDGNSPLNTQFVDYNTWGEFGWSALVGGATWVNQTVQGVSDSVSMVWNDNPAIAVASLWMPFLLGFTSFGQQLMANAWNGFTDGLADLGNLISSAEASIIGTVAFGEPTWIDTGFGSGDWSDWSKGRFHEETDLGHSTSKFLGGAVIETATGVAIAKIGVLAKLGRVSKITGWSDEAGDLARGASKLDDVGTRASRLGSISGNPANRLIETGTPLKNGFGWRRKWIRITEADALAQRQAIANRYDQLVQAVTKQGLTGQARRDNIFEQMKILRTEWLKNFLKNRKY